MHIGWTRFLCTVIALVASGGATALGFGPVRASVVLGQPLNLAVPVNLAEGETLGAECAGAEVTAGDIKLPAANVRVRVTQGRDSSESVLRISTTSVVDEPVLTVTLHAGCPARMIRTLVLLADPPRVAVTGVAGPESSSLPTVAAAPAPAAVAAPPAAALPPPRAARPAPPSRPTRAARTPASSRAVAASAPASASAPVRPAAAPTARPVARAEPRSRLQLEAGQVSINQAAVVAAQEQVLAARAAASAAEGAASAAGERVRAVEGELARLRADAKTQTEALLQLRQQLALDRAQREEPSLLSMVLLGLVALLAALVAWLGWRLHRQSQLARNAEWWDQEPASTRSTAGDALVSDFRPSQQAAARRMPSAPAPWSSVPESGHSELDALVSPPTVPAPTSVTIPPLPPSRAVDESDRAMSVDEQIDLEQQADFFIALGHDDAAIDLLMAHMRSTGGGSPLPFLKLLEIHRRRDQREAYERTRIRFNQRFNSVAPEWRADPMLGRSLEDYTLAMGRIQRAWASPLDAMAELEALLFRRGPGAELFDLPAYQEVLFLYQLARDLHQLEDRGTQEDVDVLLPIGGRSAPMAAAEGTIVLRPEFNDGQALSLDLDLSTATDGAAENVLPPISLDLGTTPPADSSDDEEDFWGRNPDARPTR